MSIVWRECERSELGPMQVLGVHRMRVTPERSRYARSPHVISTKRDGSPPHVREWAGVGIAADERVEKSRYGAVVAPRFLDFTPCTMPKCVNEPFRSK